MPVKLTHHQAMERLDTSAVFGQANCEFWSFPSFPDERHQSVSQSAPPVHIIVPANEHLVADFIALRQKDIAHVSG